MFVAHPVCRGVACWRVAAFVCSSESNSTLCVVEDDRECVRCDPWLCCAAEQTKCVCVSAVLRMQHKGTCYDNPTMHCAAGRQLAAPYETPFMTSSGVHLVLGIGMLRAAVTGRQAAGALCVAAQKVLQAQWPCTSVEA